MSTIVLRSFKGTPLTNTEVDTNFSNLNADKVEKTAAAITGGTIDGTSVGATTASTGAFTSLTATSGVVSANSSTDALRITQTGTGNALLVEDSTNPDSTPFAIDSSGRVIQGYTAAILTADDYTGQNRTAWGYQGNGTGPAGALFTCWSSAATVGGGVSLSRSRSATIGTQAIVSSGDSLGGIGFNGDDGTNFIAAANIVAEVDGTPGTNDMPGRLSFSTTADGASAPTERVRITSAGKTGFATAAPAATVHVAGSTILSNVNVLSATYDNVSFSVTAEDATPTDLFFSPDGLKMFVLGDSGNEVNEYILSTAWVVSSAVFAATFSVSSQDGNPAGLFFRADGTKMYIVGDLYNAVYQYTLSAPWSIASASYDNISFSVATQDAAPSGIFFKPNGLSMYMIGGSPPDSVYQYTLSTAWDVSTATFLQSFSVTGQDSAPSGLAFTGDGSRMFVLGDVGNDVNVYNLTAPWDISTAVFVGSSGSNAQDTAVLGLYIKPDGTKMYIAGNASNTIYQYTISSIDVQLTGQTSAAGLDVQQDLNVYGNTTGSFLNNGFRENIGGQYYNLVSQADIGTAANEIPLNQYLGDMAYMNSEAVVIQPQASVTPNGIGDMVFQLTSDTSLVIKVKGSDGTVRSATLTLA
jgi:sugar lactone lactonase YvrE